MSRIDVHPDHAMCGKVLDDMYQNKELKKKPVNLVSITTDRVKHVKIKGTYNMYLKDSADKRTLLNAIHAYNIWNPQKGEYATGYHSVAMEFEMLRKRIYTKVGSY
jgi:hypothetical protein